MMHTMENNNGRRRRVGRMQEEGTAVRNKKDNHLEPEEEMVRPKTADIARAEDLTSSPTSVLSKSYDHYHHNDHLKDLQANWSFINELIHERFQDGRPNSPTSSLSTPHGYDDHHHQNSQASWSFINELIHERFQDGRPPEAD